MEKSECDDQTGDDFVKNLQGNNDLLIELLPCCKALGCLIHFAEATHSCRVARLARA